MYRCTIFKRQLLEMKSSNTKYHTILLYALILLIGIMIGKLNYFFGTFTTTADESVIKIQMKETHVFPQRNLILSVSINMPLLNIYRFIRTARSSCNYCYIIIFIENVNNTDYKDLAQLFNVTFLSYPQHIPPGLNSIPLVSLRFVIYHRYLLKHHYDNIFICDIKDTAFQHNIFDHMKAYKNGHLYAFLESEQIPIGKCPLHWEWIFTCYGENAIKNLVNESRSCAGTILGTYKGILDLKDIVILLRKHSILIL